MEERVDARWKRFKLWLMPEHYSLYAKCRQCGKLRLKTAMFERRPYGKFCDEEEAEVFWWETQK